MTDTGNATIRQILIDGTVTTLAGSTTGRGNTDGTGTAATFSSPSGIVIDTNGNLYVADSATNTIRMVTTGTGGGVVTTLAGMPMARGCMRTARVRPRGSTTPPAWPSTPTTSFTSPTPTTTPSGLINAGNVTTLAGSAGISGAYDGAGSYALFDQPRGLTVSTGVAVYVTDTGNNPSGRSRSTATPT